MTVNPTLYMRIMGDSWTRIADPVRRLHATHGTVRARGDLRIEHGRRPLARFLAWLLRLPRPGGAADTRLIVRPRGNGELWQRAFDGRRLETRQNQSPGVQLAERFGMLEFRFHLDAREGSLLYIQREAAFVVGPFRVRIPVSWAPIVEAREDPAGPTRVRIDVRVALPGVGTLITYGGIIEVEGTHP